MGVAFYKIAKSFVTNRSTSPKRNRSATPVPTASTIVVPTSPCINHPNNSVVTKTASSRAALVARVAKEARADTTVALVADTTAALAAREAKVAREATTVASNNVPSFVKGTAAGTTCTGTIKIMPSAMVVTRTTGIAEDPLVHGAVVGITPVTTITSTIQCRPTNPRSVIPRSGVTTTIVATRNKTATKSVNGSVVVSAARAARAAKEARVVTMVVALWVVTMVVMISFTMMTSIAVIYKHSVVREVTVARVERVDTTAGVDTKSVTLCVIPSTKHPCRTTGRSFVLLCSRRASCSLV